MTLTLSSTKHETSDTTFIYANRNVKDKVRPHGDLLDEFPYLGPPHNVLKQL
jgi:hypothetical protein